MEFNATIDLIIKDLDEACKIIDDLKNYTGVPVLQVELAKSKCKSASEVISLLKNQGDVRTPVIEDMIQSAQQLKPPLPEARKKTAITDNLTPLQEEKKIQAVTPELIPPMVGKEEELKPNHESISESSIIADKFSHLSNRFNEQLAGLKSEDDLSDIMKTKQLINLSDAIGLNDKFLFIREIFDGNKDAYAQAISRLDRAESVADARAVIMSYTGNSNENEAVKQLLDLVKRKFPANE